MQADPLSRLIEGNRRFSGNKGQVKIPSEKRAELSISQHPYAIVLCCSDSRVSPEILFDSSLGELFAVRNAGNVIDAVSLASIEYAAVHLHAPLLLVLGHEKCGAVNAACAGAEKESPSIQYLCSKIKPSVAKAGAANPESACIENVKNSISEIRKSQAITALEKEGKLKILGAKYFFSTGKTELI